MELKKPESYKDLLKLQRILNNNIPLLKTNLDIKLALDDEFQEWLRELPKEYNFKNWKEKEYNKDKELVELTDCLFFFLNYDNKFLPPTHFDRCFEKMDSLYCTFDLKRYISDFKEEFWNSSVENEISYNAFMKYLKIIKKRGFSKDDILNAYWEKWQKDMKRPSEDWNLKER